MQRKDEQKEDEAILQSDLRKRTGERLVHAAHQVQSTQERAGCRTVQMEADQDQESRRLVQPQGEMPTAQDHVQYHQQTAGC